MVILGAGIIGLTLVQLARMDGARQVIILDLADNRLALARQYGADLTINPSTDDAVARILEPTEGKGAPLIIEATGNVSVLQLAFQLAAHGGRIVCAGLVGAGPADHDQPGVPGARAEPHRRPPATLPGERESLLDVDAAG